MAQMPVTRPPVFNGVHASEFLTHKSNNPVTAKTDDEETRHRVFLQKLWNALCKKTTTPDELQRIITPELVALDEKMAKQTMSEAKRTKKCITALCLALCLEPFDAVVVTYDHIQRPEAPLLPSTWHAIQLLIQCKADPMTIVHTPKRGEITVGPVVDFAFLAHSPIESRTRHRDKKKEEIKVHTRDVFLDAAYLEKRADAVHQASGGSFTPTIVELIIEYSRLDWKLRFLPAAQEP